jgi:Ran GTPase-activating protein (RanGAP) involved in mRNA processing and transport
MVLILQNINVDIIKNFYLGCNEVGHHALIVKELVRILEQAVQLEFIDLSFNRFTIDEAMLLAEGLRANKTIKNFLCWGVEHVSALVQGLKFHPTLEHFGVESENMDCFFSIAEWLTETKTLKHLTLKENDSDEHHDDIRLVFKALETNTTLEELVLDNITINYTATSDLSKMIAKNTTLEFLELKNCRFADAVCLWGVALSVSSHNKTLKRISMMASHHLAEKNEFVEILLQSKFLESIAVFGYAIDDGTVFLNYANPNIEKLWISSRQFLPQPMEKLNYFKNLQALALSGNSITDPAFRFLCQALEGNHSITILDVTGNDIQDLYPFAKMMIKHNKTLEIVIMSDNAVGDQGAIYVGKILSKNSTLKHLEMRYCHIGDDGMKCMVRGLVHNRSLHTLSIQDNPDISGERFVHFIKTRNIHLTRFSMDMEISNENTFYRRAVWQKWLIFFIQF